MDSIQDRLIILKEPNSIIAESYRSLRVALSRGLSAGKRAFTIVSSWGGEGKSMVSANLAVSLSQLHMEVILVDGDLRRPTLSRVFDLDSEPGVLDVLERGLDPAPLVGRTPIPRLGVLPAGQSERNPGDLLGTGNFVRIVEALRKNDTLLVIDTPPMSVCGDALLMGVHTDGALVVVSPDKWQGESEPHFVQDLEDHKIDILGAVMNNADPKEILPGGGYGDYGYGYGYGYGEEPEELAPTKFSMSSLFSRGNNRSG